MSEERDRAGGILSIDLDAVADNWRRLAARLRPGAECAAVIKADAYGLGAARVAPALLAAGCRTFFVATIDEGIRLRPLVGAAPVFVLNGVYPRTEGDFLEHALLPVLNTPEQAALWRAAAARAGRPLSAAVHVDTGMARLGLSAAEAAALAADDDFWRAVPPLLLLSHLACAEDEPHAKNTAQRDAFATLRTRLPAMPASLANSSGIFLGPDYHFDLARPGAALFGVNPRPGEPNPMAQVIHLQGKILQVRAVDTPMTVGYGASHRIARKGRLATVAVGYADGYLRSLSNRATGVIGGHSVPMVGRVSMDLITFDISDVPESVAHPGALIDLIGPGNPLDRIAGEAGTIGYEILTSLGGRYHRDYRGGCG